MLSDFHKDFEAKFHWKNKSELELFAIYYYKSVSTASGVLALELINVLFP
jgi:hypothetical protein